MSGAEFGEGGAPRCRQCGGALGPAARGRRSAKRVHLSERELEVAREWMKVGPKNEVGRRLHIATCTVSSHIWSVYRKYTEAGRPTSSKIDLLQRLVEDGHAGPEWA